MPLTESGNPNVLVSFDVQYLTEVVELNPYKKPNPRHTGHDSVQKGLVCAQVFARNVEDAIVRLKAGAPVRYPVIEIAAIVQSPPLPDGGARTSESVIGLPTTSTGLGVADVVEH